MPSTDPSRCLASEDRDDNASLSWDVLARREDDINLNTIAKMLRETHLPQPDRLAAYEAELERRGLRKKRQIMTTIDIPVDGSGDTIRAEVHDGEAYLSIIGPDGHVQRTASMETAVGRIFPDWGLVRRMNLAASLLTTLAASLAHRKGEPA